MIDYYTRIAPVLLPHLRDRPLTLKRYPDGVEKGHFYEKRCPKHRPVWVETASVWSGRNEGYIDYCLCSDLPTVVWLANLADLELHTPMARAPDMDNPVMVAFDLDPGPPATVVECARVALVLRQAFEHFGLSAFAKTSGSKGMQVYLPLNVPGVTYEDTRAFSRGVAHVLARRSPDEVLIDMNKTKRAGKVFVDWSQNDRHKTTVNVYSLRAMDRPTVSTPVTWDEVSDCADGRAAVVRVVGGAGAGRRRWATCSARFRRWSRNFPAEQRAPVVGLEPGGLGRSRRSRSRVWAKRSGSSWWGMCPAFGKTTKRLSGIASWAASPCLTGMIESFSPQTISVGRTAARCRRSLALTRWPETSITARTVCRKAWREPLLSRLREALGEHGEVALGVRCGRVLSSEATPRPAVLRPARGEHGQDPVGAGEGGGAQQQVDLLAQAAAGDEPEPLAALGELVGELHRHAAAERVADDRDAVVAERGQQVAGAAGVGAERVVAARRGRRAVAEQVGRDQREVLARVARRPAPTSREEFAIPCRSSRTGPLPAVR